MEGLYTIACVTSTPRALLATFIIDEFTHPLDTSCVWQVSNGKTRLKQCHLLRNKRRKTLLLISLLLLATTSGASDEAAIRLIHFLKRHVQTAGPYLIILDYSTQYNIYFVMSLNDTN